MLHCSTAIDGPEYGERQSRAQLQTESPSSKARREQSHQDVIQARRRSAQRRRAASPAAQSVQRRSSFFSSSSSSSVAASRRGSKPLSPRDAAAAAATALGDPLEMQESQNGLYVTVPELPTANETQEIVIETLGGAAGSRRTSATKSGGRGGAAPSEQRVKKIVAMPASLYNHFRPVESNIPIEDMSQFLYFGQKLRGTGALGKEVGSSSSPKPKKLLAGLEEILDEEMNSVDRSGSAPSAGKSTKMRTTSLRERTTTTTTTRRPACPDKVAEVRANSINATDEAQKRAQTGRGLRIVVTEATTLRATLLPTATTTTTFGAATVGGSSGARTATTTTVASDDTEESSGEVEKSEKQAAKAMKKSEEQQEQQHQQRASEHPSQPPPQPQQRHRAPSSIATTSAPAATAAAQLRNSRLGAAHETGGGGGGGGDGGAGPIASSSSSPPAAARSSRPLSTGATVEQAAAAAAAAPPPPQPGFTIRWTDPRPASAGSKRRRLAAAASRRRDKSARAMEEPSSSPRAPPPTAALPVTPGTLDDAAGAPTGPTEEPGTTEREPPPTTLGRMLDPSEVQKMYRAGGTPKPEPTAATSLASTEAATTGAPRVDAVPAAIGATTTTTTTTTPGPPPDTTSGRSAEARSRNMADKAKDDVLPIMQLYNTSSMFNDSLATTTSSTTTTTTTTTPTTTTTTTLLPEAVPTTTRAPSATPTLAEPASGPDAGDVANATTTPSTTTATSTTPPPRPRPAGGAGANRTLHARPHQRDFPGEQNGSGYYPLELGGGGGGGLASGPGARPALNASEVISRRHDGDALASQETVAVVSYVLATLVVFPIALGIGLILRRLILRNRKVLEESDTSSEISCRKDALNLETGDFKMSIEKTITKLPRIQHLCHEAEKPPPPASQESRWEFPRDKLRLQTVLGEGNFGQVWKAEADDLTGHQGTTRLVAVKTVKEGASDREKEDLVRELEIMQKVGSHPNVVTLLGCCTEQEPHYLILEYVMYGKLLAYLRDHRTRQDFYNFSEDSAALTSRDLTVFGYCVARGMEYLASKKIIHRDLAARNVLVDHNKLCKIADFGMSRFANEDGEVIETRHGRNALPIRWMAPESLVYSLFTTKTDVWSFGILMWEIVTLGSTPYPDMTAREVMRNVQSGYRLERPSHCRSELFRVIARCWHDDPDRRPEFQALRRDLAQLLEDGMNGHYVDLESFASECTD